MEWLDPVTTDGLQGSVPSWFDGFLGIFGLALVVPLVCLVAFVVLGHWGSAVGVRRRFWCRFAGREVEVEFLSRGLAAEMVAVKSCSAFEPRTVVTCRQQCLETAVLERPAPTALSG